METALSAYLPEALQAYPPLLVLVGAIGLLMLLVLVLVWIIRAVSGRRGGHGGLVIQSFQVAPLGRDAFLKISNPGPPVTLTGLIVTERADVMIKNQVTGQQLSTGDSYSILIEATANERLRSDFHLHFSFFDREKRNYQQQFSLDPIASIKLK